MLLLRVPPKMPYVVRRLDGIACPLHILKRFTLHTYIPFVWEQHSVYEALLPYVSPFDHQNNPG